MSLLRSDYGKNRASRVPCVEYVQTTKSIPRSVANRQRRTRTRTGLSAGVMGAAQATQAQAQAARAARAKRQKKIGMVVKRYSKKKHGYLYGRLLAVLEDEDAFFIQKKDKANGTVWGTQKFEIDNATEAEASAFSSLVDPPLPYMYTIGQKFASSPAWDSYMEVIHRQREFSPYRPDNLRGKNKNWLTNKYSLRVVRVYPNDPSRNKSLNWKNLDGTELSRYEQWNDDIVSQRQQEYADHQLTQQMSRVGLASSRKSYDSSDSSDSSDSLEDEI